MLLNSNDFFSCYIWVIKTPGFYSRYVLRTKYEMMHGIGLRDNPILKFQYWDGKSALKPYEREIVDLVIRFRCRLSLSDEAMSRPYVDG